MSRLRSVLSQLHRERTRVQAELEQLDQAIQTLSKVAGGNTRGGNSGVHRMSLAARKRIAAAQRARWAKFHANRKKTG
jgi:hypothetical protein